MAFKSRNFSSQFYFRKISEILFYITKGHRNRPLASRGCVNENARPPQFGTQLLNTPKSIFSIASYIHVCILHECKYATTLICIGACSRFLGNLIPTLRRINIDNHTQIRDTILCTRHKIPSRHCVKNIIFPY